MSLQLKFRRAHGSFAIVFVAITILVSSYFLLSPMLTIALTPSWISSADPMFETHDRPDPQPNDCDYITRELVGLGLKEVCLTRGKYINFASYFNGSRIQHYASFPGDTKMYLIKGIPNGPFTRLLANTDSLVMRWFSNNPSASSGALQKYDNIGQRLQRKTDDGIYYQFNSTNPDFQLRRQDDSQLSIDAVDVSSNGKWIIARTVSKAFIRIESATDATTVIDRVQFSQPNASGSLGISNDGRYIVFGGYASPFVMYDTVSGCGDPIDHLVDAADQPLTNPCPKKDYTQFEKQQLGGGLEYMHGVNFRFSEDASTLDFNSNKSSTWPYGGTQHLTLTMPGYTPPPGLDYLALGDSYSSGEGDTEKDVSGNKYYRPWTNMEENQAAGQPREKCHISTRSYPYLLAQSMSLERERWNSVACSGATAWDVKGQGSDDYKGQIKGDAFLWSTDGREERLKNYDSVSLKWNALNEFIPGRQKQIEFMKKYRPKAVTLTVGGNDVKFGEEVGLCALPLDTCEVATDQGRKKLGQKLQDQFENLKSLYKELHDASPSTKIYVLGYPQLIKGESSDIDCLGFSIGGLNAGERRVIAEAVSYLNHVIDAAARHSGVKYLYIEDALNGHRMCDGLLAEHYMTGFTYNSGINPGNERQESLHPNAKGNKAIADAIKGRLTENGTTYNPLTYPYLQTADKTVVAPDPAPSDYLAWETNDAKRVIDKQMISTSSIQKDISFPLRLDAFNLAPSSEVNLTLHSDPLDLGTYVASPEGSLDTAFTIPNTVAAGYHRLVLTGKTYSGEPIQYEQVVFVHGSNLNDIDEDGLADPVDPCLFITPANIDHDQDGTDDACDPQITEPPIPPDPYRIRAGNPARTYAGQPEASNALYLERNINAAAHTGITGDYDPDHDGWVVVATNQPPTSSSSPQVPPFSTPPLSPYAKFWLEDITTGSGSSATTIKLPHISFRTKESGCAQYKPTNLTKVTEAEVTSASPIPRTFTQEATDTNTCRSEPSEADTDNNGQPDNTQPLYRARNGDTTKGENPSKLYLERSTRAAEAQLGKSDYALNDPNLLPPATVPPTPLSPTDTKDYRQAWSLLATTPYPNYALTNFTKLKFINNYPFVLSGYSSSFYTSCSAYKPESTGTIKQSTQSTRALQIDLMQTLTLQLRGGCN